VCRQLSKKHDIKINYDVEVIEVLTGLSPKFPAHHDVGNGSWGKIDYLVNIHHWRQIMVDRF